MKKSREIDFDNLWSYIYQRTLNSSDTAQITKKCLLDEGLKAEDKLPLSILPKCNKLIASKIRSQESAKFINNLSAISSKKAERYASHIAIRKCSLMQQEIVGLLAYTDLNIEDVAKITGISTKKIEKEINSARRIIESNITNFAKLFI